MKIEIRKAKKEDIKYIKALDKKLNDYHLKFDKYYRSTAETNNHLRKYISDSIKDSVTFVATGDKKIIGFMIGVIEKTKPFIAPAIIGKIYKAFVLVNYRKKRIGKKLLNATIDWYKKRKIRHIEISVDSRNEIGLNAWQKFGFKEFAKKLRLDL